MSTETGSRFETPEQAWGAVELRLRNYPDAGADRGQRIAALRNIAEGLREYWLLKGDRQVVTDKIKGMELPVTLLGDTDLALGEISVRANTNQMSEADWDLVEGIVGLREVVEQSQPDDPGIRPEFKDHTQDLRRWVVNAGGGLSWEKGGGGELEEREVEPTQAELKERWDRIRSLEAVTDLDNQQLGQLVKDVVVVFAAGGIRWSEQEIKALVFLRDKFGLVERGLRQLEAVMRNGDKDRLRLYWSFVFALPRKNLSGQQQGALKRAYRVIEEKKERHE
ncbi:MAG: hypothetical protein A2784_00035 [Candidatus Chisholmbacteria bacterium RIFCSPHIGHO2_01_FULL_48_12]|uniref:Uncharacterized protein n=1 Tax=Candidatus Chisholmbacteria bacterium RIFCSPHIGHO2_01_FULL_48_12 TaxID=1797589 RepID=A0A1G1VKH0_9BACT|nr:MAG: hypothetical protein A2784_00035 [Candidatus Chisholmbacteria bacterium RIFCSPHIGHO2_01_FULL_48_12]